MSGGEAQQLDSLWGQIGTLEGAKYALDLQVKRLQDEKTALEQGHENELKEIKKQLQSSQRQVQARDQEIAHVQQQYVESQASVERMAQEHQQALTSAAAKIQQLEHQIQQQEQHIQSLDVRLASEIKQRATDNEQRLDLQRQVTNLTVSNRALKKELKNKDQHLDSALMQEEGYRVAVAHYKTVLADIRRKIMPTFCSTEDLA